MIDRRSCSSCDNWTCLMSSASLTRTCSCKNLILACLLVVAVVVVGCELLMRLRSNDSALFVGGRKTVVVAVAVAGSDDGPSMLSYHLSWHLLHGDPHCFAWNGHHHHRHLIDGHHLSSEDFVASLGQHKLEGPNRWLERYLNRTSVGWLVVLGQWGRLVAPIVE